MIVINLPKSHNRHLKYAKLALCAGKVQTLTRHALSFVKVRWNKSQNLTVWHSLSSFFLFNQRHTNFFFQSNKGNKIAIISQTKLPCIFVEGRERDWSANVMQNQGGIHSKFTCQHIIPRPWEHPPPPTKIEKAPSRQFRCLASEI